MIINIFVLKGDRSGAFLFCRVYKKISLLILIFQPIRKYYFTLILTHLILIDFPTPINWTSPFPILGVLGGIFLFFQISDEYSVGKQ